MNARRCLFIAAVLGFLAVLLGAFGAHGLSDTGFLEKKYAEAEARDLTGMTVPASFKYMRDFETGVRYHMWHTLALMMVGVLMHKRPTRLLSAAAWCFSGGTLLFSGALYVLVIGGPRFAGIPWGLVAPIGGTLLMLGWISLAIAVLTQPGNEA